MWSEQPLILQLWRFANGGPLYDAMRNIASYDYGPMYLWVLSGARTTFRWPFNIVVFRDISLCMGLLSVVPLTGFASTLARRLHISSSRPLPFVVVVVASVGLALGTLTRNWTFDGLHPDNLVLLWVATGLWLYGSLVERKLAAAPFAWLLGAVFVAAVLTKLNVVVVFPCLVIGLIAARAVSVRLAVALCAAYAIVTFGVLFALPPNMQVWTFLGPLHQPYPPWRWSLISSTTFQQKAYLGALLVAGCFSILALRWPYRSWSKSNAQPVVRGLIADYVVVASAAIAGFGAFLKRGGGWHDMAVVAFVCIPYVAVFLGELVQWRGLRRTPPVLQVVTLVALGWVLVAFAAPGRRAPDAWAYSSMDAMRAEARTICDSKIYTLVTVFPSLFFGRKNVTYGLVISYGEARNSFEQPATMSTLIDSDPGVPQIVWLNYAGMPEPWRPWLYNNYRLVARVPVALGYQYEEYVSDATVEVYRRIGY